MSSASDDPSGLAVAETLQTKVSGLQQSATNVQTAGNLLNVADAALSSVQGVLQRVRSLVVQSRSDIESRGDLSDIQAEIGTLLAEVNKIASNAAFNGVKLFDGSLDTSGAADYSVTQVPSPVPDTSATRGTASDTVANADGFGTPGKLITLQGQGEPGAGFFVPSFMVFEVTGYDANAVDPDSGASVGPGVYIKFTAYSTDPSLGAAPEFVDVSAVATNAGPFSFPTAYTTPTGTSTLLTFNVPNLTQADVGTSIAFVSKAATAAANGHALYVNDGGDEGQATSISLPNVSTNSLGVSDISVLAPDQVNFLNQPIGADSSNTYAAASAELKVDAAIDKISQVRAQVGAQTVSLGEDASAATLTAVNLTEAESRIRDADIGATVTEYTKNQIIAQVGTGILAQMGVDARLLTSLLLTA